jgi:aminomuconate-semialdehyde/2-hydroxymuconate-6-semialdehyde dehydrogenase
MAEVAAREWLKKPKRLFIGGEWVDTGKTFATINPATEEKLADIVYADKAEVDQAVKSARATFESGVWSKLSQAERADWVRKIGDAIADHKEILAILETWDTGKPILESAEGDIPRASSNFHFFAEFGREPETRVFENGPDTHRAFREPLGVVALVTPWNLPLYLETWKIAPALLMGNSVILKPSELTPLTALYFTEILETIDFPKGVFQLLNGFGEKAAGEYLTSHPGIDAISFTGETGTGRAIMKAAANGPTRVSFELGGKGASVVFADADWETTLSETLRAGFRNQGEVCLAGSRLFVEKPIYDKFVETYVQRAKEIRVGDPMDTHTNMGALIGKEHYEKVTSYIKRIEAPAKILTGGGRPAGIAKGYFVAPTVVAGLTASHPVSCEEIFGPVVSVYPFETEDEVAALVNGTPYGLSASIYTKNVERAERMSRKIRAGMVWINCWFARDLRVPFGGQKKSGIGREGGTHSLDFFSEWKSVCTRRS